MMIYAYANNGLSMRSVDAGYTAQEGEVLFDHEATPTELTAAFSGYAAAAAVQRAAAINAPILAQLDALDAKSVRAARAVAVALAKGATPDATDLAKLAAIEAQAATLRGQLVS